MSSEQIDKSSSAILQRLADYLGTDKDAALSKRLGFPKTTVSSWRTRGSVPFDKCVLIADNLGLSVDWVLTGRGRPEYADEVNRLVRRPEPELKEPDDADAFVQIPIYRARVAAGDGLTVCDEATIGDLYYRRDWLARHNIEPRKAGHFHVQGNSMYPVFSEPDLVLANFADRTIVSGKPYVLRLNEELMIKYLSHTPDGVVVSSENRELYTPFNVPAHEFENGLAEVIGRVCIHSHVWI